VQTSDDYLLAASKEREIFEVRFKRRKPLQERLAQGIRQAMNAVKGDTWPGSFLR
jgi:hypothetical protein